ncbi:14091_t:CDS:2 [Ambispora leptoticha]|uniref:14091_t:CDS:1 n=1 Tax=Ambispora leptoticha TaxID=144679 RepID=A0A9N9AVW2_9GLOM|nr:14091_t:CDS:2 [Ambispora leptoticha]
MSNDNISEPIASSNHINTDTNTSGDLQQQAASREQSFDPNHPTQEPFTVPEVDGVDESSCGFGDRMLDL